MEERQRRDKLRRKFCAGCDNDFYNGQGAEECWNLERAEVVWRKEVHINQVPPWKQKPIRTLNCYRKRKYWYIDPEREC